MAEKNTKKKSTKNNTSKKTAGNTSSKKSTAVKSKAGNTKKLTKEEKDKLARIERREKRINHLILAVILLALSLFLIISMYTKIAGIVGRGISYLVLGLFGYMGYVLPFYFLIYSALLVINKGSRKGKKGTILFTIGFFVLLSAAYSINRLDLAGNIVSFSNWLGKCFTIGTEGKGGGFIGMFTAFILTKLIGKGGAYIVIIASMIIATLTTMNKPFGFIINFIARINKKKGEAKKEREQHCLCDEISSYDDTNNNYLNNQQMYFDDYIEPQEQSVYENEEVSSNDKANIENFTKFLGIGGGFTKKEKKSGEKKYYTGEELEGEFSDEEFEKIKEKFDDSAANQKNEDINDFKDLSAEKNNFKDKKNSKKSVSNENKSVSKSNKLPKIETYGKTNSMVKADDGDILDLEMDKIKADLSKKSAEQLMKNEGDYSFPPIELLKSNSISSKGNEEQELSQKATLLERTLESFNVNAKVIKVSRGPAVTRFEVQPATGVKVNSIVRLQDDIALNLEARSIRMEAPIPGKAAVGIEIENAEKKSVLLREVVESDEFRKSGSKITFGVGRDISGNSIVANLKEMPHLLIAGSTGSGKSVCVNSIVMSILFKARPDEVRFIMVDPKVVELSNYNGIPHLLIPVVTEASKAAAALNWAVKEMEDRYRKFQEVGVRNLASFNLKAEEGSDFEKMPQIVIIIDELADLMMAAPQQVEDAICRLAQKARAAGMHLIVATQRPSVDVITGVIKANIPSRIAFAVSSQIDSRTILDSSGAEKLVGKGDMLFSPLGMGKPLRVQGTFVSDEEVQSVIDYVSNQGHEQEFSNDLMDTIETAKMTYDDDEVDELLKDAIEHIVNVGQASVSMLQRRFRIGYNRAARLVDMMEERGIVGPQDGSRPRKVFLTKEGLAELDRSVKDISVDKLYMNGDEIHESDFDSDGVPEEI